jgi:A/G-specific adenine glycosylase
MAASAARDFAPALLRWFRVHGRKDLPWQQDPTPYRVWVSEIMLQQTRVVAVAAYFPRFLDRFPSVNSLADAPLDAVLHRWSGLGYYARARNLHRAARLVRDVHRGEVPRDFATLCTLPGIGPSTAGAILALACGQRHAILDGNVKRVLARWFGVAGFPGEARIAAQLWRLSESVTPASEARAFTQAIMDLGATVCTRAHPDCAQCPVAARCRTRRSGRQREIPAPRPKRMRPRRAVWWLVLQCGGSVLLEQRPPSGVWGGLWSFPEFRTRSSAETAAAKQGILDCDPVAWPAIAHSFTHFELSIRPLVIRVGGVQASADDDTVSTWYNARRPAKLGLAAPVTALLERLAR